MHPGLAGADEEGAAAGTLPVVARGPLAPLGADPAGGANADDGEEGEEEVDGEDAERE